MKNTQKRRFAGLDDWEVLCQFLPVGWQEAAFSLGAIRRQRHIRDPGVLLRTLLTHLADGCSLQETAVRARKAGWCSVSAVALFKRLQGAEQWLRWMGEQLWRRQERELPVTSYRPKVVDATTVRELGVTGSLWRVHFAIRLGDLQCDFFELTDDHGGETFRRIPVIKGDLVLGDRAYGTANGIRHVVEHDADVLVRVNWKSLPLYDPGGRRMALVRRAGTLRVGQIGEWPATVRWDGGQADGRLVAIKRGHRAAQRAQRRVLRKAMKNHCQASPTALAAAQYVFVWTTVPVATMAAWAVLEYYRLRWQIELAIKRMKSILGLGQLPKRSDASSRAWMHGKLLVALLIERLLDAAETFSPWGYRLEPSPQPLA